MQFLDSYRFLSSSLDAPSKSLSDEQYTLIKERFPTPEDNLLLRRKGVYHYSFFKSFEDFESESYRQKKTFSII